MSHTTVFVVVDAGRADYVRPETMPFVHALSTQSLAGSFDGPAGFAQRSALFSGRYPDASGNFSSYVYDPEGSPFAWVKGLGPLAHLVRPRRTMSPARRAIARTTKWVTGTAHDPAWIPLRLLPHFRPADGHRPVHEPGALGVTSLFDLCREHDLTFRYHSAGVDNDTVHTTLVRELRAGTRSDLHVAHFRLSDHRGHAHGPSSEPMQKRFLRDLDDKIASMHAALGAGYDSWDLFICGEHGMAPVNRRVNILAALKNVDAVPAQDYVVFVNSTMTMFWYLTPKGQRAIEAALPHIGGTSVVSDDDRRRHRIPTGRAWGDRILAADPGVLFWPDYFHVANATVAGMHGYLDKSEEAPGMGLLASSNGRAPVGHMGTRPLVDAFATLCDLLGVEAPPEQEGLSLLRPLATPPRPAARQEAGYELHGA